MKKPFITLFVFITVFLSQSLKAQFTIGGDDRVKTEEFKITVFEDSLNFPVSMQQLSDSSLLVAVSNGDSYFGSTSGSLIQLSDSDGDGISDQKNVLVDNVPDGGLSALRIADDLIFTTGQGRPIVIYKYNPENNSEFVEVGKLTIDYDGSWLHKNSTLSVRFSDEVGKYDLFFNIGSAANFETTTKTASLSSNVGTEGDLNGDAIYMVQVQKTGSGITVSNPLQIATGLRNAAGMAFHPITGDLYFADNGIDGVIVANEPTSADEINMIPKDQIGGTIEDFGFPGNYTAYRTGSIIGGEGIQPLVAFQPRPDPQTGDESEGPNEITFAPPDFPDSLNSGIFVSFHGKFSLAGLDNEENPLVFVDTDTWEHFHFIDNKQPNVGHLDGLFAVGSDLYVSDFSSHGGFSGGAKNSGKIYKIQWNPTVSFNISIFLEGSYNSGSMTNELIFGVNFSQTQPFNTVPWNYTGSEVISNDLYANGIAYGIVDWVLVVLRDKTDPSTVISTRAAFLMQDGTITEMDGTNPVKFDVIVDNYYVSVHHRNHLSVMSANPVTLSIP